MAVSGDTPWPFITSWMRLARRKQEGATDIWAARVIISLWPSVWTNPTDWAEWCSINILQCAKHLSRCCFVMTFSLTLTCHRRCDRTKCQFFLKKQNHLTVNKPHYTANIHLFTKTRKLYRKYIQFYIIALLHKIGKLDHRQYMRLFLASCICVIHLKKCIIALRVCLLSY